MRFLKKSQQWSIIDKPIGVSIRYSISKAPSQGEKTCGNDASHANPHRRRRKGIYAASIIIILGGISMGIQNCIFPQGSSILLYTERVHRFMASVFVAFAIISDYKISLWSQSCKKYYSRKKSLICTSISKNISALDHALASPQLTKLVDACNILLKPATKAHDETHWQLEEQEVWNKCHLRSAERLRTTALKHGGLYIKSGQTLTMMNHILPPEYYRSLQTLQDNVRESPYEEIRSILEEEYGCSLESVFSYFEEAPIAAASIAQVHRAMLREKDNIPAQEVAVKVQHDDVARNFEHDFRTIQFLCMLAGSLFSGFNFSELLQSSKEILRAELDFRKEAQNTELCGEHLRIFDPEENIVTPKVYHRLTSSRVLVTEFVHGHKITDIAKIPEASVKEVASRFIDTFCYQIFTTGFVHADPHPGNVFIRRHPKRHKHKLWPFHCIPRVQMVLLDHGLYTTLSEEERLLLCDVWLALATRQDALLKDILQNAYGIHDQAVFGRIFLMRPYEVNTSPKKSSIFSVFQRAREYQQLLRIDRAEYQRWVVENMDRTTKLLGKLPPSLVLVLRNMNAVRAVHQELGAPVNRIARMTMASFRNRRIKPYEGTHEIVQSVYQNVQYTLNYVWISLHTLWQEWCFRLTVYFLRFVLTPEQYADLKSYPIIG